MAGQATDYPPLFMSEKKPLEDKSVSNGMCKACEEIMPKKLWEPLATAPKDGRTIIGLYDDGECEIRWADLRRCVLATVAPGAGEYGPGWEDLENCLPVDAPSAWRPA